MVETTENVSSSTYCVFGVYNQWYGCLPPRRCAIQSTTRSREISARRYLGLNKMSLLHRYFARNRIYRPPVLQLVLTDRIHNR